LTEQDRERRLLLVFGFGSFIVSLDARVIAPLLPAISSEFGISSARAGWVISSYLLPYGFFQLVYGPIADRFGKIRVAAAAMVVFSVLTALSGAFADFDTLILLRALTGGAAAAMIPLAIAFIGDTVPYARRQVALSRMMATMGTAHAVSTVVGGAIGEVFSWREVFLPLGLLSGVVAVLLVMHREPRPPPTALPTASHRYTNALAAPQMIPMLLLVAFEGCLFMGVLPFLSVLLEQRFSLGSGAIGLLFSLSGVAQLLAAWCMPFLVRRLPESAFLVGGGCIMAVAYLIVAAAPTWPWAALGSGLIGFGFSLCHSTLQIRATEAFPQARATALALFAFSLFSGSALGSVGFSWASGRVGYGGAFAGCGLLFLVFTATAWRVLARRVVWESGSAR
jgi:predicted MFS family arabinose efflux permease